MVESRLHNSSAGDQVPAFGAVRSWWGVLWGERPLCSGGGARLESLGPTVRGPACAIASTLQIRLIALQIYDVGMSPRRGDNPISVLLS
jgi:hypothetical protein